MNDRIRELAEQAGITTNLDTDFFEKDPNKWVDYYSEKFAELIIAKCIEEAGEPADGLINGDTWHDGVRASVWSIKHYFGVEE